MNAELCSGFGRYHTDNPNSPKSRPYITVNYAGSIIPMAENPPTHPKQAAQWFIPSVLLSRNKSAQMERGEFYMLVADIDHNPPLITELYKLMALAYRGVAFLIYASRSATENNQKSHVLIPTVKLTGYRWMIAQQVFNDKLQAAGITPDRKTEDANQIIYLPNRGGYYSHAQQIGGTFNPMRVWHGEMIAKHEQHEQVNATKQKTVKPTTQSPRPTNKNSLIDAFNAAYSVHEVLQRAGYAQKGDLFRHPNSNTGNYSASVQNGRVFTLSSADPLYSERAHDAFNAFVVLFGSSDRKSAMIEAGNNWLSVGGMTWNEYHQKQYRERSA